MVVGVLILELYIPDSGSLKGKRKEIKSIKDRLRKSFNVSVSEIDNHDLWQRSSLGIAVAGGEVSFVQETLDRLRNFLERNWAHLILNISTEVLKL